jgi:low affinity Fe/Cu permease
LAYTMARPAAFVIVFIYGIAWAFLGHIDWHGVATLATWLMTLLIQRAEHRDTQAIPSKAG